MKKVLSLLLVLAVVACFSACNSGEGGLNNKSGDGPVISLYADKSAVAPGDELVISVNVADAENCACFDLFVTADSDVQYISTERGTDIGEFMIEGNLQTVDDKEGVVVGGIIMTAYTLDNDDILNIKYIVPESAKTGKTLTFNIECISFDLSKDETGAEIYSVLEDVALNGVTVKVAEESVYAQRNETATVAETTEEDTTEETTAEETTEEETTLTEGEELVEEATDEIITSEEEATEEIIEAE